MPDTVHAYAVQSFDLANTERGYPVGAVIENMAAGQFADLEAIGLVREATAEEVASANRPAPLLLTQIAGD